MVQYQVKGKKVVDFYFHPHFLILGPLGENKGDMVGSNRGQGGGKGGKGGNGGNGGKSGGDQRGKREKGGL